MIPAYLLPWRSFGDRKAAPAQEPPAPYSPSRATPLQQVEAELRILLARHGYTIGGKVQLALLEVDPAGRERGLAIARAVGDHALAVARAWEESSGRPDPSEPSRLRLLVRLDTLLDAVRGRRGGYTARAEGV